jgi:hypothetical protein
VKVVFQSEFVDTLTYVLEKELENLRIFIINNRKTESFGGSHYVLHVTVLPRQEIRDWNKCTGRIK